MSKDILTTLTVDFTSVTPREADMLNDEKLHAEIKAANEASEKIKEYAKKVIEEMHTQHPGLYAAIGGD